MRSNIVQRKIWWQIFYQAIAKGSHSGSLNLIIEKVNIATLKEETRVAKERVGKSEQKLTFVTRVFSDRQTEKLKVPEVEDK